MNINTTTENGSVSHGRAALDSELNVDEILDRFTLALARRMARDDHETEMQQQAKKAQP